MNNQSEHSPTNIESIVELGNKLYSEIQDKENIVEKFRGHYIAIDVKSGKYFINENRDEAIRDGEKEFPNVVFYVKRIGGSDTISRQYPYFMKRQYKDARIF
jgi:hypothetical protein